ncbi:kinase-like protein [Schizopora paradoxa]|uniref:Kinase-like protein n=1 Tax=Schizopora paradoxa TaxID=27342 RepID=A0A0H2R6J9_9AGAM|nr:kinase-like protein [Schizopora paradoxa]
MLYLVIVTKFSSFKVATVQSRKRLTKVDEILSSLVHLDLEGAIVDKEETPVRFGGQCDVFRAKSIKHNKAVAVKRIRAHLDGNEAFARRLAKEIGIWATLEHENVLPLWGFIFEGSSAVPSLVSEWMDYGILPEYMEKFPRASVETCKMLVGVASGLSYLHSKGIIHADLKGQNIFVSAIESPLLADFGLSRMIVQSGTMTVSVGTMRWMARELLTSESNCNEKTDVWAFGMVVYELLSRGQPYADLTSNTSVWRAITSGKLPAIPKASGCGNHEIFERLWNFCRLCWQDTSSRPSARGCRENIGYILQTTASPTAHTPKPAILR